MIRKDAGNSRVCGLLVHGLVTGFHSRIQLVQTQSEIRVGVTSVSEPANHQAGTGFANNTESDSSSPGPVSQAGTNVTHSF